MERERDEMKKVDPILYIDRFFVDGYLNQQLVHDDCRYMLDKYCGQYKNGKKVSDWVELDIDECFYKYFRLKANGRE